MSALGKFVDQAPEDFLAGSALTQKQHRDVNIGDERGLGANLAHGGTGRDEKNVLRKFFDFATVSLFSLAQTEIDDGIQFRFLKRLGQVVLSTQLHRVHYFAGIVDAGQHHNFDAGLKLAQLLESLQAIDAGHENVEQHQIGLQTFFHTL